MARAPALLQFPTHVPTGTPALPQDSVHSLFSRSPHIGVPGVPPGPIGICIRGVVSLLLCLSSRQISGHIWGFGQFYPPKSYPARELLCQEHPPLWCGSDLRGQGLVGKCTPRVWTGRCSEQGQAHRPAVRSRTFLLVVGMEQGQWPL